MAWGDAGLPVEYEGPGLVDIQVNGYAGLDFNGDTAEWTLARWQTVQRRMQERGVAACLPTLVTDDRGRMLARARAYAALAEQDPALAAFFPGLHIEGPFISPADGPRGAHPRPFCAAPSDDPHLMDELLEASDGRVLLVTLAPELPGALALIARLTRRGVAVGLGHTQARPEELGAAASAGARLATHLGNGSHPTLPRLDNYVQAQLAEDRLMASFIADGHHIPPFTLKNMLRAKGYKRSILTTDAMSAAELGPGRYHFAGQEVEVSEELRVAAPGAPNLAGSALTLDRAVLLVTQRCGVPFSEAWAMASTRPASFLGLRQPDSVRVMVSQGGMTRLR